MVQEKIAQSFAYDNISAIRRRITLLAPTCLGEIITT